jgi:N-acylglucosamine-6-phosphate 2-epimerase
MLETIHKHLIVSCQALEDEPLHSSFIMSRMAVAAKQGGAAGIRANSTEDIQKIKKAVDLPVIGIIKKDYPGFDVYITPTMKEVDALVKTGVDVIAMDATGSERPEGAVLQDMVKEIRRKYPQQHLMADCSTVEEAVHADELGFDFIGTTLVGYTAQSKGDHIENNDFEIIREILAKVKHPVIAEGNIDTPDKASRVLELGCWSVVVGSIITRPQIITKRFTDEIERRVHNK